MKKSRVILLFFFLNCFLNLNAQTQVSNKSNVQTLLWPYKLPNSQDHGPMDVTVHGTYHFTRERWGETYRVHLNYTITKIEYLAPLRFLRNGVIYRPSEMSAIDGLGSQGFDEVDITGINIKMTAIGVSNAREFDINKNYGHANYIGDISPTADLNSLSLDLVPSYASNIYYTNPSALRGRIDKLNKLVEDGDKYKTTISQADAAFNSKDWLKAKSLYESATRLFPNENYPKEQLDKIKNEEARKSEEKRRKEEDEKRIAEQRKADEKNAQQNYANQNSSKSSTDDFWNETSPKKSSVEVIPHQSSHDKLPDLVRTTNGGYYQRGSDGQFREINQDDYYRAKNKSTTNQEQERQPTQQEIDAGVSNVIPSLKESWDAQQAIYDDIDKKFARLGQLYQQNYYTAEAIRNGKENLEELSTLSGNHKSVQEIESEFNRKNSAIRAEVNRIQQAKDAHAANVVAYNYEGASEMEQAIGVGIQTISNMVNAAAAQKAEREAREALKYERDRQIAALAAAQLKARIEVRQNLVKSFPHGGTPLTSHKINESQVYMFAYIVDETTFPNQNANITISNVFTVYKYGDGTFPYANSVSNKLKDFGSGKLVLVGYYLQKDQAEKMHTAFLNLARNSELTVNKFEFGLKAPSGTGNTTTNSKNDFWGEPLKEANKSTTTKSTNVEQMTPRSTEEDFWGAPVKTTPTNQTTPQSTSKPATTKPATQQKSEEDFWGVPVKTTPANQTLPKSTTKPATQKKSEEDFWGAPVKKN